MTGLLTPMISEPDHWVKCSQLSAREPWGIMKFTYLVVVQGALILPGRYPTGYWLRTSRTALHS
jgi:hypothetical protein